jgi:hypothetical protein
LRMPVLVAFTFAVSLAQIAVERAQLPVFKA